MQSVAGLAHVRPLSILLADDYESNRMMQQAQVQQLGYPVDAVANGEEVLRALNVRDYDVVLLDIRMPVMDGLECARYIRTRKNAPQPFIVAVTADALSRDREQIVKAGIDAYIGKPVEISELAGVLCDAYERQSVRDSGLEHYDIDPFESVKLDLLALQSQLGAAADDLLRHVIPSYLRELPDREKRLRAAYQAQDVDAVAQLCHGLKGASRVVGAAELAAICDRLEQGGYAGSLPAPAEIDELLDLARRTAHKLRRKLTELEA